MPSLPAIVISTFNRPEAFARILGSIANASYQGYDEIPLVISIDGGGEKNDEIQQIASDFQWAHGDKRIIDHKANLGLRDHIISCGDLTHDYYSIILLEEDCFVSHNYYDYACQALDFYKADNTVAGISLYANSFDESGGMPFSPVRDGNDVYFMQVPCSWGEAWTQEQWNGFKEYYRSAPTISPDDKLPEKVKTWPESSWKKYFYKYLIEKELFFAYPHTSFSTNFGDKGTHHTEYTDLFQVPLENRTPCLDYHFIDFSKSNNKYDAYFEMLPTCLIHLGADIDETTCIDLMGSKPLHLFPSKFALSVKECNNRIHSFSFDLLPPSLNIIHNRQGDFFNYGLIGDFTALPLEKKLTFAQKSGPVSFAAGARKMSTSRYYKLGFYLRHPRKALDGLKRRLNG